MVDLLQDSLHTFAIEIGLLMAGKLLNDELDRLCGPRYGRSEDRKVSRFGSQQGYVVLGGQKIHLQRPRIRYLREGMEETLTVIRLGVPELLRRTQPIRSSPPSMLLRR